MAKHWSATSFMALWCLVEAQQWQNFPPCKVQPPNFTPQLPVLPKKFASYQPSLSKQHSVQNCEVAQNQRIKCGGPDIFAADCDAISCCFDGHQCYFGKAVTVQCTIDGQFIVVVARDATLPNFDLESISLLGGGQGCTHVGSNSDFAIYQFPVTACGTIVKEEPGVIIYENRMSCSYDVEVQPLGAITRDITYELLFQCRYIGNSVEVLALRLLHGLNPFNCTVADEGPIHVQLKLANGQCHSKGCDEVSVAYGSFYTDADYPVTKVLKDPVYVEVQLMDKTNPNLILNLDRCWTTSSHYSHSLPQWDILIGGCPNKADHYWSTLVPLGPSSGLTYPTHHKRFIFKMFTFVSLSTLVPLKEKVYIHCNVDVCTPSPGQSCVQPCYRKKRDIAAADQKADLKIVVSSGLVIMVAPQ